MSRLEHYEKALLLLTMDRVFASGKMYIVLDATPQKMEIQQKTNFTKKKKLKEI